MEKLFPEFSAKSKAAWLAKVEKDLKGKPLSGLNWEYDEKTYTPFYHAEDLPNPPAPLTGGRRNNEWEIGENIIIKGEDYKTANAQALSALTRGANALCFEINETPTAEEMRILLQEIQHEWISTHFVYNGNSYRRLTENFSKILAEKGQNPAKTVCSFQTRVNPLEDIDFFKEINASLPSCHLLKADVKDAKSGNADTIAAVLHKANAYLHQLYDTGLDLNEYYRKIQFSLSAADDYFPAIAQIRALKILWQKVLTAWHPDFRADNVIEVHLTEAAQSEDEHYNKIKASVQAMAAIIGGATRLYIHPSDQFKNSGGDNFSRRIALNVQHILQQESYLHRTTDPAAGSYFIENLTDGIAEKAWKLFCEQQ